MRYPAILLQLRQLENERERKNQRTLKKQPIRSKERSDPFDAFAVELQRRCSAMNPEPLSPAKAHNNAIHHLTVSLVYEYDLLSLCRRVLALAHSGHKP